MIEEFSKVLSSQPAVHSLANQFDLPKNDECIQLSGFCSTDGILGYGNECCPGTSCRSTGDLEDSTYQCLLDTEVDDSLDSCAQFAAVCNEKTECCAGLYCTRMDPEESLCINAASDPDQEKELGPFPAKMAIINDLLSLI